MESDCDFNDIGVRSFILSGAPFAKSPPFPFSTSFESNQQWVRQIHLFTLAVLQPLGPLAIPLIQPRRGTRLRGRFLAQRQLLRQPQPRKANHLVDTTASCPSRASANGVRRSSMFSWKIGCRSPTPFVLKEDASTTIPSSPPTRRNDPTRSLCNRPTTAASAGQGRAQSGRTAAHP